MHTLRIVATSTFLIVGCPALALAGMPSVRLTDIAKFRLESISFFLVGFLLCAGMIQRLWNWLRKDFTFLPRLSYPKAVGVITLWGLLFVLVLTMISGARELMTPGAWEKNGLTYRLARQAPVSHSAEPVDAQVRQDAIDRLRLALWKYAESHYGHFPESTDVVEVAPEVWQLPGPSGLKYIYLPGQVVGGGEKLLAYEPELDGSHHFALMTNGQIQRLSWHEVQKLLSEGKAR
jgi:hypothetical protein